MQRKEYKMGHLENLTINEQELVPSAFRLECIKMGAKVAEWRIGASTVPEWDPGGSQINSAIVACKKSLGISIGSLGDVWDDSWNSLTGPEIINRILDEIEAIGIEGLLLSQGYQDDRELRDQVGFNNNIQKEEVPGGVETTEIAGRTAVAGAISGEQFALAA